MTDTNRTLIVTKMKNEGPFILEWLAHHINIGVDDFLIYSNDCTDGTDQLLNILAQKNYITHRENPFRETGRSIHQAVYHASKSEPVYRAADRIVTIDVDEFINIHTGTGHLDDLYNAVPNADLISMTWRMFGNSGIESFRDAPVTEQFTRCAPEYNPRPIKAWCFKTLFRNDGTFARLDTHRPKKITPGREQDLVWVNGSGKPFELTEKMLTDQRRSTNSTYGYNLVTLNHYAVRSAASFIAKANRGDAIPKFSIDLEYWFCMNNNGDEDFSFRRYARNLKSTLEVLLHDDEIRAAHAHCVREHEAEIARLLAKPQFKALYEKITSRRFHRLSQMHSHFAQSVFVENGHELVPDALLDVTLPDNHIFTARSHEHHPIENCALFKLSPLYAPAKFDPL